MRTAYRTDVQGVRATRLRLSELLEEVDAAARAPGVPTPVDGSADGTPRADAPQHERGVAGTERRVAESLDTLRDHGWAVLHGLTAPDRPGATVDHVAVGPGGVVVVHVRSWSGTVSVADGRLRQNGYRRDQDLRRAAAATRVVARALPVRHRDSAIGLICLARHDQELAPTSPGVPVVGRDRLADVIRSSPDRLTAGDVTEIVAALGRRYRPDGVPQQRSSSSVQREVRRPWFPAWAPWRR